MRKNTIFVQIASYRDPELVPTLDSLLENAKYPNNLHICVAFQFNEEDEFTKDLNKYRNDNRFTIIDIPYPDAKGACYARNLIQQEYKDEKYTLQLDSHHRFVKDWDTKCIKMFKQLQDRGHKKPLLTSYIPSYNPENEPDGRVNTPWGMSFDRFTPEGVVFFLPYYMENQLHPVPARFFSAHFAFTLGEFSKEVQHDPSFYFHGEEITLAVRAYTHGYDLFHPNQIIAWHEYTRKGRVKNWDDNKNWVRQNELTHSKVRQLLGIDGEICSPCNKNAFGKYGLGDARTLEDYEIYSGIRFKDRGITKECKTNSVPGRNPNPEYFNEFKHAIDLNHNLFTKDDYNFCAFIFEDNTGKSLHREDMPGNVFLDYIRMSKEGNPFTVWKSYNGPKPARIIVWPHSEKEGWVEQHILYL